MSNERSEHDTALPHLDRDLPTTDADGNVQVDLATVINPKVAELGKPVYSDEDVPPLDPATTKANEAAKKVAAVVTVMARDCCV